MDNLESIQKSHEKEIIQIQDACNQQGIIAIGYSSCITSWCGSQEGGLITTETDTGE